MRYQAEKVKDYCSKVMRAAGLAAEAAEVFSEALVMRICAVLDLMVLLA